MGRFSQGQDNALLWAQHGEAAASLLAKAPSEEGAPVPKSAEDLTPSYLIPSAHGCFLSYPMLLGHCPLEHGGVRGGRNILCLRASAHPLLCFLLALLLVMQISPSSAQSPCPSLSELGWSLTVLLWYPVHFRSNTFYSPKPTVTPPSKVSELCACSFGRSTRIDQHLGNMCGMCTLTS